MTVFASKSLSGSKNNKKVLGIIRKQIETEWGSKGRIEGIEEALQSKCESDTKMDSLGTQCGCVVRAIINYNPCNLCGCQEKMK